MNDRRPLGPWARIRLETITPLFLSGADQSRGELRAASVRGMLRFWFRATRGAHIDEGALREEERGIFGAPDESAGASKLVVRLWGPRPPENRGRSASESRFRASAGPGSTKPPANAIAYLGYGPYQYERGKGNITTRTFWEPGTMLTLELGGRLGATALEAPVRERLLTAVRAWLTFGGLGSRSRKGFGSLAVAGDELGALGSLPVPPARDYVGPLCGTRSGLPSFTRFSPQARYFVFPAQRNWSDALGFLGQSYKQWRLGVGDRLHSGSNRRFLGAPLMIDRQNQSGVLDRRSGPYFLHVFMKSAAEFVPAVLCLPARFGEGHPDTEFLRVNERFVGSIRETQGAQELTGGAA